MPAVPATTMADYRGPVLLFDGECGLCNFLVRVLLKKDREARLRFAAMQGAYGQAALRAHGLPTKDFDSLVFLPAGVAGPAMLRSDGALAALEALGGHHAKLARLERKVPVAIRDLGYNLVARTRYAIFGRYRPRPLPNPAWAERFID